MKTPTITAHKQLSARLRATKNSRAKKPQKNYLVPPLSGNLRRSLRIIKHHRGLMLRLTGIYAGLYFIFVRAITKLNLDELRDTVAKIFGDGNETITSRIALAGTLFSESTNFDQATGLYFVVIFVINSLALMWVLKYIWAKKRTTIREAYYQGMYPLVPVLILVGLIFIQSIPLSIGSYIAQVVFSRGLAINFVEKAGVVTVLVSAITLTGYWVIGSILAIYASSVPGMTPLSSLKEAKRMLKGRRFLVLRQVAGFMLLTGVIALIVLLAVVYVVPDAAIVAVTILMILMMPWSHLYLYGLYRDLLND